MATIPTIKVCNPAYRVDYILVSADQKALTDMQTKINTWITTQQLVKVHTSVVGNQILFEVCRKKVD